jgi:hypothetical protein
MGQVNETEKRIGEEIVAHVQAIAALIREAGAHLEAENKKAPRDAYPLAGHIAGALARAGARLGDGNPHKLVWPFERKARLNDPSGLGGTIHLAKYIAEALVNRSGQRGPLEEAAELWTCCATRQEIDATTLAARALVTPGPQQAEPAPRAAAHSPAVAPRGEVIPLVDKPSPPPGKWVDGEYRIEQFVRQPTVG